MANIPDPTTRQEQYLAAIAGSPAELPEFPITREEAYLQAILDNGGGGGGGGGTTNYNSLENKPKIANVELKGNKTLSDFGIASASALTALSTDVSGKVDKETGKGLSTNDFTDALKDKLSDIPADAEKNVQADWNQTNPTMDDFIKNKPTIPDAVTVDGALSPTSENPVQNNVIKDALDGKVDKNGTDSLMTAAERSKLSGIEAEAEKNVQSDWDQETTTADDFIKNKPTKVSDFTNDSGFITKAVNDLANYYLKTQTYTKAEVDDIVTAIKNSRFEAVNALPTTDIQTNVIYLVPKATPTTSNAKDEYINLDGTTAGWEKIGDTEIDLSGYVTTTALNTALADYTTTTDLTTLLAAKADKTDVEAEFAATHNLYGAKQLLPHSAATITHDSKDHSFTYDANDWVTETDADTDGRAWNNYALCNCFFTLPAGSYKLKVEQTAAPTQSYYGFGILAEDNTQIIVKSQATALPGTYEFTLASNTKVGFIAKCGDVAWRYLLIDARVKDETYAKHAKTNRELTEDKADKTEVPTALADLTADSTHRTVTDAEKSTWNGKTSKSEVYQKFSAGSSGAAGNANAGNACHIDIDPSVEGGCTFLIIAGQFGMSAIQDPYVIAFAGGQANYNPTEANTGMGKVTTIKQTIVTSESLPNHRWRIGIYRQFLKTGTSAGTHRYWAIAEYSTDQGETWQPDSANKYVWIFGVKMFGTYGNSEMLADYPDYWPGD